MVIYKIENKINGKVYIGQTIQKLSRRIAGHVCPGNKYISVIDKAIKKYGIENFLISQIDHADSIDELNEKEIYWIKYYNCIVPNGYNIEKGGKNSPKSDLTKRKISVSNTGKKIGEKSPRAKRVFQFSLDGTLIAEYGSAREAGRKNNMSGTSISSVCRGNHYISNGFLWSYEKDKKFNIPSKSAYLVSFMGETLPLKSWCIKFNLPYNAVQARLKNGWSVQEALTTPIDKSKINKKFRTAD